MAQYKVKGMVVVNALSFDELVGHGKANGANMVNGMPWSFEVKGVPVTHENDECYLIGSKGERFTKADVLMLAEEREHIVISKEVFDNFYEPFEI